MEIFQTDYLHMISHNFTSISPHSLSLKPRLGQHSFQYPKFLFGSIFFVESRLYIQSIIAEYNKVFI